MKSFRHRRVADMIAREVAHIMRTKAADKRFDSITITGAKVSKDLKVARVYYSVMKDEPKLRETIEQTLEKAAGFFRSELGSTLKMRYTPEIRFEYDQSIDRGHRIINEIEKLRIEDESSENDNEI